MPSRKQKRRRRPEPAGRAALLISEGRVTEYLTTGWLLTVLTTLFCELGGAAALWWANAQPQALPIAVLSSMLLFAAAVTGVLGLLLLVVVWKLRKAKPPLGITAFSLVVSLVPIVVIAVQAGSR